MKSLSPNQIGDLVIEGLSSLGGERSRTSFVAGVSNLLLVFFETQEYVNVIDILDKLYTRAAFKIGITSNP